MSEITKRDLSSKILTRQRQLCGHCLEFAQLHPNEFFIAKKYAQTTIHSLHETINRIQYFNREFEIDLNKIVDIMVKEITK